MAIAANAQLTYRDGSYVSEKFVGNDYSKGISAHTERKTVSIWFIEFKLGDYLFVCDTPKAYGEQRPQMVGGKMKTADNDAELWAFINRNKEKIEKKFGVKIVKAQRPVLEIYDADDYNAMIAKKTAEKAAEQERKSERLNSLNKI